MKKMYLPLFILTMAVIIVGIIIFQKSGVDTFGKNAELIHVGIIVILFSFGIFLAIRRIKNTKYGLPAEDELSKKIEQKAASKSFFVSLFLWLIISYIQNENGREAEMFFGYGIIGMALLFAGFYFYYYFKGNIDE
jgi:uncharacterized membrane protein